MAIPRRKFKNPPAQKTRSLRSGGFGAGGNPVPPDSSLRPRRISSAKTRDSFRACRAQMALQPSAEQLDRPQPARRRHFLLLGLAPARNPKPVIPATFFAFDLNIKSAESATLPSRPRASCSQPALLRVSYCQRLQTSSASRSGMPPPRPPAGRGAQARRPRQKSSLIFQRCSLVHIELPPCIIFESPDHVVPFCAATPYNSALVLLVS